MSGGFSSASISQMPWGCSRKIASSEFVGQWFHGRPLSIRCLDVVCLLAACLSTSANQRFFLLPRTTRPTKPSAVARLPRLRRMSSRVSLA